MKAIIDHGCRTCATLQVLGPPGLASTGVEQAKAAIAEMFGEDLHSTHAATITADNYPVGIWSGNECYLCPPAAAPSLPLVNLDSNSI